MAFQNMIQQLLGIPGTNLGLVKTFINEALALIQQENVWTFQQQTGGWLTPGVLGGNVSAYLSPGTISIQSFSNQMTGDAVATAAWYGASNPSITSYQIRVPYYALYSIIGIGGNGTIAYASIYTAGSTQTPGTYTVSVLDNGGSGTGATVSITVNSSGTVTTVPVTLTAGSGYTNPYIIFSEGGTPATFVVQQIAVLMLDRLWTEPSQTASNYLSYQAYFAAPAGLRRIYDIRDTVNNQEMDFWSFTQVDLAREDPQRTLFAQPEYVVYLGPDVRAGSATYGQSLFELWNGPLSQLPYVCQWQVNWPPLVNPNDTVPPPLTDELVKWRAQECLAIFKESQKGDEMERGSGANWQFLAQYYHEQYEYCLKKIRIADRNIVDLYFQKMNRHPQNREPFASVTGQMSV